MRLLVAYEERHRAYRDTIAEVLVSMRPQAQVEVSALSGLREAVLRLVPHVVVANSPNVTDPSNHLAEIELPAEPNNSAGSSISAANTSRSPIRGTPRC